MSLAPLVVLAPRCGLRPPEWGQRLDVALGDALGGEAGGETDAMGLAEIELRTVRAWKADPKGSCKRFLTDPATKARVARAEELLSAP